MWRNASRGSQLGTCAKWGGDRGMPRGLDWACPESFNLVVERKVWLFWKQQENQLSGFQFSLDDFTTSACPREKRPIILWCWKKSRKLANRFTTRKEIPSVASARSYVGIIWSHGRETLVPGEVCGDFLGTQRCQNILTPWIDSPDSPFDLNFCQTWLMFQPEDLSKVSPCSQNLR